MTVVYVKKGDRYPLLTASLQLEDGTAIDLTGGSVKFIMATQHGQNLVNASAVVVGASSGTVRYDWAAGDTDVVGKFRGEFEATLSSGKIVTVPNDSYIDIRIQDSVPTG